MKRASIVLILLLLPAVTLLAQEGAASESHAGGGEGWMAPIWHVPTIFWQIANLVLVIGLFVFLFRRPAPQFFRGRAKEILDLFEKAVKEKEEALARLQEVEDKMGKLGDELSAIDKSAKEAAEADRKKVQSEADEARERIRKEASEEMERRIKEARRDLRVYAADLAVAMAKELAAAKITEEDEKSLQARFLSMMEGGERGRRG